MKTIILLALSSFCLGVAEFIISGILPTLSQHFGVPVGEAGNLSTLYALGVVIGAPIISVLISRWNYKTQLVFTLLVFCFSNAVVFFSTSFPLTLFARFVVGLMHCLFFVIATIVVIRTSEPTKISMGLSLMVSGLTIALVTGIPIGIFLSEHYGLLSPFAFVTIISFCVAMAALYVMPSLEGKKASFTNLLIAFRFPPIYQGFLITAFACGSQFVLYVYLRVFLEQHGFEADIIKHIFIYYGIAAILGNLCGGKFTEKKGAYYSLLVIVLLQIISFALMSITHVFPPLIVIINIICMAFFGFASIAPLKMLSTFLANKYTPDTQNNTIALNEASFNLGIALAAFIGGLVEHYIHVNFNGLFGALFSLLACVILLFYIRKVYDNKTV